MYAEPTLKAGQERFETWLNTYLFGRKSVLKKVAKTLLKWKTGAIPKIKRLKCRVLFSARDLRNYTNKVYKPANIIVTSDTTMNSGDRLDY